MIWFTGDQHFNHTNIIEYCDRPFATVDEMNAEIVARWNDVVRDGDDVYVLGDFTLGENAWHYFAQLKGNIFILPGCHDHRWIEHEGFGLTRSQRRVAVLPQLHVLRLKPMPITLCHYAMRTWYRSHHGSFHLHAHSHGRLPPEGLRRMDVGVDAHHFNPVSLDEVLTGPEYVL